MKHKLEQPRNTTNWKMLYQHRWVDKCLGLKNNENVQRREQAHQLFS